MLQPKRTKFRKQHKGRIHGAAKGGTVLNFGEVLASGDRAEVLNDPKVVSAYMGETEML